MWRLLCVSRGPAVDFSGRLQNGRDFLFRVWLLLLIDRLVRAHLLDEGLRDPSAPVGFAQEVRELGDARCLRRASQSRKTVRLEILQNIDAQFADEDLVLAVREVLQSAEEQFVLRRRLRLHVITRIDVTRNALLQFWPVDGLILGLGIQRPELRFGSMPVTDAERLPRILLLVRRALQPDRAVAILEILLLVGLETELVDPAIDGVSAVDSERHNRIIHPVFVQPSVQRSFYVCKLLIP